jgi:hypothetical protein
VSASEPPIRRLIINLPAGDPVSDVVAAWATGIPERQQSAVVRQALHAFLQTTALTRSVLDPATQQQLAAALTHHLVATLPPLLGAAILQQLGATLSGAARLAPLWGIQDEPSAPPDEPPPAPTSEEAPPAQRPPPPARPSVRIAASDLALLDDLVGEG